MDEQDDEKEDNVENIQSTVQNTPNMSTAEVRASTGNSSISQDTYGGSGNTTNFMKRNAHKFPEEFLKHLEARNNFANFANKAQKANKTQNDETPEKVQKLSGVQGGLWEPEDIIIADSIKVKVQFTSPPDTCTLMISAHGSQFLQMGINWNLKTAIGKSKGTMMQSFSSDQWYEISSGSENSDRVEAVIDEQTNGLMYRVTMQIVEKDVGKTNLIVQPL